MSLDRQAVDVWSMTDDRYRNWPVVYVLDGKKTVYVGESLNVAGRLRQHIESDTKASLTGARVIVDERFNKSACLDLESWLIQMFAGDGKYEVLNRNDGIANADYFDRAAYQSRFQDVFAALKAEGLFKNDSVEAIENENLFKLSPFKALTDDQRDSVAEIVTSFFQNLASGTTSQTVIEGEPGTGKTVVAIFLLKLLADIKASDDEADPHESTSMFSSFFTPKHRDQLSGVEFGIVIPQQALRNSVKKVFKQVSGLHPSMVVDPFSVGKSGKHYDLLIVDEAHRLSQRSQQASGVQNGDFKRINVDLFAADSPDYTQLDWIEQRSSHQILLVDAKQTVRPGDLPADTVGTLLNDAREAGRFFKLKTQHRVAAGDDYVAYIRAVLSDEKPQPLDFGDYDVRFFDDIGQMESAIRTSEAEEGLSRLLAGYAWKWASKDDSSAYDIAIGNNRYRWNSTLVDWIASPGSIDEVGSIHTTQGYDLNYAGVIIGKDLRYDPSEQRMLFDRSHYFDARGKANNKQRGITYGDDDILDYIRNVYAVL
ncbi:MAG: DNA/RNA helicase domain-containing protein, partial [Gordonia sp. (in: high G+C Gram-positive bacteria)]|uniref:DNA/RNA helicase domain-containing protein n=1 Tax=Gordonia sp. (in: high G+C Gram-positive bacteria) TaxID=84139 RepID=UPI003C75467C